MTSQRCFRLRDSQTNAKAYGLLPGYAIDLETGWNLLDKTQVKELEKVVDEEDPYLLTGSPPCGPFSPLQNLNKGKVDREVAQQRLEDGKQMLETACEFYERQIRRGRYFSHEHPKTASSWKERCIEKLADMDVVRTIEGPMCRWKMVSSDATGKSFVKKQTKWLTNSPVLAEILEGVCSNEIPGKGWRRHVHLVNGRAKMARIYPPELGHCQRNQTADARRW